MSGVYMFIKLVVPVHEMLHDMVYKGKARISDLCSLASMRLCHV